MAHLQNYSEGFTILINWKNSKTLKTCYV